jgi:hypothetical protein
MKKTETYIGGKANAFSLDINSNKIINDENIQINEINLPNEKQEEIKSSVISQLKTEITSLKDYIKKMNIQIRKNFNLEIQLSIEESFAYFSQKIKNGEKTQDALQDLIHEWMNKLFNMDYINPLITLYENYIKKLEQEITNYQNMAKKNENLIMKLVLENNELRDKILTTEEEMKNFLEIRNELNDGSSIIVMDRDHVMKIEERNKLLSKENEILVVNYNKIQNELLQLKNQNQIMGNDDINIKYQKLNSEFNKVKNDKDELFEQNNIIYEKMNDISNMNNNLERENFKLKDIINKMNNEIEIYKEANKKYENMINNENK